jgi:hypothetical protein
MALVISELTVLALTPDEARTLTNILSVVGGDEDSTDRKYSDSVLSALTSAGFNWTKDRAYFTKAPPVAGPALYFNDPDHEVDTW